MTVHINQPHGSVMPIKFSPCATNPCDATPNRGHVPTKLCTTTNRAARPSESCKNEYPSQASRTTAPCACPSRRHAYARALGHAVVTHTPEYSAMHSAVHTPEHSAMHSAVHMLDTSTWPCIRSTRALGRAYAQAHPQSCPSHLGPSELHTLIYEQYALLLLIYP